MNLFWRRFFGALRRVFPACIPQSQAIAFNMFLAVFPMMLIALGVVATSLRLRLGLLDAVRPFRSLLPPGGFQILAGFLTRHEVHAWRWISLGLGGTLLAGAHGMRLTIDGVLLVHGQEEGPGFWNRNLRAVLLLLTTMVPWLVLANLIVFGKQMRAWMILHYGLPVLVSSLWSILYVIIVILFATIVMAMVYRISCPGTESWNAVMPGAALATLLWWLLSSAYGLYMRHVPYGAVYGGLAATIGLLLWMQVTATIVLFGAAFNAECAAVGVTPARLRDTLVEDEARGRA
jgi:membrane protein